MSLKNKTLIGAAAIILVVLAIRSFTTHNVSSTSPLGTATTSGSKKIAFSQLVRQGGTYKCSVTQNIGNVTTQGLVYMDKGFVRGEFKAPYNGQVVSVSFLMRDGLTYVWNSMAPTQGVTMKNNVNIQTGTNVNASPDEYLDQIGDYTCDAGTFDASVFVIPTTIKFKALN